MQISDDVGVRNFAYTSFNELEIREGCKPSYKDHPCLWLITWDPTQPVAMRPLAIQKDGTWYTYGWDLTKNICEIFGQNGYIRSTYVYTPFGSVTDNGDVTQPIQWSSEYYDNELALVYYNYRHYNPTDGRWINRDPIAEQGGWNLYGFVKNLRHSIDFRGLNEIIVSGGFNLNPYDLNGYTIYWYTDMQYYTTHLYNAIGFPFDIICGFHDRNWANFITSAEEEIKKRKEKLKRMKK